VSVYDDPAAFRKMLYGLTVERAAANLPQTAAGALFTIAGGRVIITSLVGEVTTVIQTQANAAKLTFNGTVDNDICGTLDITGDAVGTLYGITGTFSDALVGAGGAAVVPGRAIVAKPGTIDLNCAASNTGQVKWTLTYVPLDAGATVTAA
jgi:hypothetical protein